MTATDVEHTDGYALVRELADLVGERLEEHSKAAEADGEPLGDSDEQALSRALIADAVEEKTAAAWRDGSGVDGWERRRLQQAVFDELHGRLGRIQPLVEDETITDIHINGCDRVFVVRRDGSKQRVGPVADSDAELVATIQEAARRLGRTERQWNPTAWKLDLRLPSGARLHAIMDVSDRPAVTIRRHDLTINQLDDLVELGLLGGAGPSSNGHGGWPAAGGRRGVSADGVGPAGGGLEGFLRAAIAGRCNLIVTGGTNTGKTTTLRALLNEVPSWERLVVIEDQAELGMQEFDSRHPDLVSLVTREANVEGTGKVTALQLVYEALRMDPDRVIIGELRGEELLPMLLAMSQGNDGSMSTMHADSPEEVVDRLPGYGQMADRAPSERSVNALFGVAVDFVVHIEWDRSGVRRITSVHEVLGISDGRLKSNELWGPGPNGQAVPGGPPTDRMLRRLTGRGFVPPNGWEPR